MNTFFQDKQGNPIVVLGLQAHNSSTGTPMIGKSIEAIGAFGGNTLEAPIYWYAIEPQPGVYDFSSVSALIDEARNAGLYLIPLWFGANKNGHPNYVPEYIKLEPQTYRLAIGSDGAPIASLSPHCEATLQRDCAAFLALIEFIRSYDEQEGTVIAIQLENETGLSNSDRDYGQIAQADYEKPFPAELESIQLEDTGETDGSRTWRGRFGRHAHEAFSAYFHALYLNRMAKSAKEVYPIPMITNVMVGENGIEEPGHSYNSGAAVGRMLDVWKAAAPDLDLLCPDIYQTPRRDYLRICSRYDRPDNSLFIPESSPMGESNAMHALEAFADYQAIGLCCFGAESVLDEQGYVLPEARPMSLTMRALASVAPLLLRFRGTGKIHALIQEEFMTWRYLKLDAYHVKALFMRGGNVRGGSQINLRDPENAWRLNERGRGLLIQTDAHEFYLAGAGLAVEFTRRPEPGDVNPYPHLKSRQSTQLNHLSIEEGHFEDDEWVVDAIRNGDEANFAHYVHDGQVIRIRLNPNIGMDVH